MNLRARLLLFTHHLIGEEELEAGARAAWRTGWDVMQPKTSHAHERFKCECSLYRGQNAECAWHSVEAAKAIGDYGFN